jgi:putative nucleotidyltransferase with HDIG domain
MVERDQPGQIDERSPYAGRWIACIGGQIVGHGGTPKQALHAAQASRFKETPQITYVATEDPILVHPILKRLASIIPQNLPVFVVGGAVRNALTKRPTKDFDFTLPGKAIQTARRIADALDGAFYALDKERDFGRVIIPQPEGEPLVLDFSPFQGTNLEEDLRSRDFTINAIAFDINRPQELLDPLGGAADLYAKRLRACTPDAFTSDPVRILRGIRFSVSWEMRTEPGTQEQMRAAVGLLPLVSDERLRDELFHLLETPKPATAIRILDYLDAIPYVLPELNALKGLEQSPPHTQDAWQHSLDALTKFYTVLDVLKPSFNPEGSASLFLGVVSHRLGRYREQLEVHLNTRLIQHRSFISLIFLAALYHDIGKPDTQKIDQDGRTRYLGHEEVGAELVVKRGRVLQLSNSEIKRLKSIVYNHMRPLWLTQTGKLPSRRAIYRFFRDTGPAGVDICLLSLADTLATYGPALPPDLWAHQVDVIRALLESWWEKSEEVISPPALIDGNDLIGELGLKPGPIIGQVLRTIQEAQATGNVVNRRQAFELASKILENSNTEFES